jgi:hypothetical protein
MELILHIANATFSSLELQTKQSKCLKNTAFKQKTFRIVKERTIREGIARSRELMVHRGRHGLESSRPRRGGIVWRTRRWSRESVPNLVEPAGIEPATFWLQTRRSPS